MARPADTDLFLVLDLIAKHRWKFDIIYQVFEPLDAVALLSIALSRIGGDNDWFWQFDNKDSGGDFIGDMGSPKCVVLERQTNDPAGSRLTCA
ncbi:hypothetical protein K2173_013401 [Erythroxylum novogranatense]|uniref:Uncharacterized protein n=1 Tax=Erythroxylum novogranatense TaxID=1862640 RepID=A0AAV8S9X4_9ROSI|nr:hypothetical protein K2173_013401 [Erythroxylum novogranatense]